MTRARAVAATCALAAVLVSGGAAAAVVANTGGHVSILVRMSYAEAMANVARRVDPHFAFVPPNGHYDGVYFYEEAMDPLALGKTHTMIDHSVYRYGHAGFGMLAWAASGGHATAIPWALLGLNLAAVGVATASACMLAVRYRRSPWWGLFVGLQPGIVFAVTADTSEPVGIAFAIVGVALWLSGRKRWAALLLACAVLCKEPFLLVPAGLLAFELLERVRRRVHDGFGWRVLALAVPFVVFAAWQAWVRSRFGQWPVAAGGGNLLTWPFKGWIDAVHLGSVLGVRTDMEGQVGTAMVPMLFTFGAALLIGVVRSIRVRTPFAAIFLLLAALSFCFSWAVFALPRDLLRWSVIPLCVLPATFLPAIADPQPPARIVLPDERVAGPAR